MAQRCVIGTPRHIARSLRDPEWRAEIEERAPGLAAQGGWRGEWWGAWLEALRAQQVEQSRRPKLRLIIGGKR